MGYARSPFRDFESFLRFLLGWDEDDIQIHLKHNNSNFVTYELLAVIHTIKHISEAVYTMSVHEGTLQIE